MTTILRKTYRAVRWLSPVMILCLAPGAYRSEIRPQESARVPIIKHLVPAQKKIDLSGRAIWLFDPMSSPLFLN